MNWNRTPTRKKTNIDSFVLKKFSRTASYKKFQHLTSFSTEKQFEDEKFKISQTLANFEPILDPLHASSQNLINKIAGRMTKKQKRTKRASLYNKKTFLKNQRLPRIVSTLDPEQNVKFEIK